MEEGPFVKGHELFALIQNSGCMGVTYETDDQYAAIWFKSMTDAAAFRKCTNERVGWSIISKPEALSAESESNPFACDAVCVCPLPKRIADRNEKYGGNAMAAALDACRQAGIQII